MFIHKQMANGRWLELSFLEQLGNIGSEVGRAYRWQDKNEKIFNNTVDRALELFDLTLSDLRWRGRLVEIGRARELFCDAIFGDKQYKTKLEDLEKYFNQFAFAAQNKKAATECAAD